MKNSAAVLSQPVSQWLCVSWSSKVVKLKQEKPGSSHWQYCSSEKKQPSNNRSKPNQKYSFLKILQCKDRVLSKKREHFCLQNINYSSHCHSQDSSVLYPCFSQLPSWGLSVGGFESHTRFRRFGCCSGILESWIWPTEYEVLRGRMQG